MAGYDLTRCPNAEALAQAAAAAWLDEIAGASPTGRAFHVALSGGRIAATWFAEAARQATARNIAFNQVHFFWADERCVPPDDPASNYRVARKLLLDPLGIAAQRIHRVRGEWDSAAAARAAAIELGQIVPLAPQGQPVLDLILLGMGEDGHMASLFPGEPATVVANPAIYHAVTAPKPPPQRVTLGYGVLMAAREVWVLISGRGKDAALRSSLLPDGRTPLATVLHSRPLTRIFSDLQLAN